MPDATETTQGTTGTSSDAQTGSQDTGELRIKGLQTALNQKEAEYQSYRTKADSTIAALTQESRDAQTRAGDIERQLADLRKQFDQATQERDKHQRDAATSGKALSRMQAIAKYPQLLADEEQGLLRPDLEGEAFADWLGKYAQRLGNAGQQAVTRTLEGATPASSDSVRQPAPDKTALMSQIATALRDGKLDEYDRLMDQLVRVGGPTPLK